MDDRLKATMLLNHMGVFLEETIRISRGNIAGALFDEILNWLDWIPDAERKCILQAMKIRIEAALNQ